MCTPVGGNLEPSQISAFYTDPTVEFDFIEQARYLGQQINIQSEIEDKYNYMKNKQVNIS